MTLAPPRPRVASAALGAYVAATAVGVVLRLGMVVPVPAPPFDHLLHAHSHTLYFGWAGLAVWALAFTRRPPGRALARTVRATVAVLPALFVAFLAQGYGPVSIAVSTVMMLLWYAAVGLWWRENRRERGVGVSFLRAGFAYVVVSSLGVWVLAALQATGAGTALSESLAVHAFLLGFARFFLLAVLGLLADRGMVESGLLARLLPWWVALGWVTFPLGVAGGPEAPVLGPLARAAGLALLVPSLLAAAGLVRGAAGMPTWIGRWLGGSLAAGALLEAAVAVAGTPALVAGGRHGVVLYLHVFLLGFVTTALFVLLETDRRVVGAHVVGTSLLLAGLGVAVLVPGTPGLAVAAAGAAVAWAAGAGALAGRLR